MCYLIGSKSMRQNRFEEVSNEDQGFLMEEGEDHKEMYRRLKALAKRFKRLGADHVDDTWVRRKYVAALMHFKPIDLKILKNKHNFYEMTSNEVMQEVEASIVETKVALDKCNRALGERRGLNLALKAKGMEMEEEDEADHDPCAASSPEDIKYDLN